MTLPADVRQYPDAIAQALSQLRLVGVNGPYSVVLGADAYTALSETVDNGYPVLQSVKKLVKDEIIRGPGNCRGVRPHHPRGGDFDLHIGQDVSIGYLSHPTAQCAPLSSGDDDVPHAHFQIRSRTRAAREDPVHLTRRMERPDGIQLHLSHTPRWRGQRLADLPRSRPRG